MLASQGLVILVNIFHGVAANAAMGIANQVSAKVTQFFTNFQMAFNPQIVKKYAAGETESMYKLIFSASKISYYIMLVVSLPLILEIDSILNLWLISVPLYTKEFSQLILAFMLIEALSAPLWMFVQATGQIKVYQVLMGFLIFLNFPIVYIVLSLGYPVYSVWVVRIIVDIVTCIARCFFIQQKFNFPLCRYVSKVILPILIVSALVLPIPLYVHNSDCSMWSRMMATTASSILISAITIYFVGLDSQEKELLLFGIKSKLHHT